MKKVAVCISTYNESENIQGLTKQVDNTLVKYGSMYQFVIVNADNNSPDNQLFNNVDTYYPKISLIDDRIGKIILVYISYLQKI